MIEERSNDERVAQVHFWPDGSRVTGNSPLPDSPFGVIIGDSFAEADQIDDERTLSAILERTARAQGDRLNVRQYGWSGASIPDYVGIAPRILNGLRPRWVVALLNISDLGANGLTDTRNWTGHLDANGSLSLTEITEEEKYAGHGLIWRAMRAIMGRSTLAYALIKKLQEIIGADKAGQDLVRQSSHSSDVDRAATRAGVRALGKAYGARLRIVYVAKIQASREKDALAEEADMLEACATEGIRCTSLRPLMVEDRDLHHVMWTGFPSHAPGDGHLNFYGTARVADLIRALVSEPKDLP